MQFDVHSLIFRGHFEANNYLPVQQEQICNLRLLSKGLISNLTLNFDHLIVSLEESGGTLMFLWCNGDCEIA